MKKTGLSIALTLLLVTPALGAKFANQFVEFELPPKWQCNLEGAEWVCQSTNKLKKREAIVVLAAKIKGQQDSLDQYLAYLKGVKTFKSLQGKSFKSKPKYAKTANINGHPWVDSLHLESEIPGFYTRYLATVKKDIGVVVTYSINQQKYKDYLADFNTLVNTLKVFRRPGAVNQQAKGNVFSNITIPADVSTGTVFPGTNPQGGADGVAQKKKKGGKLPLVPLLLLGAGVALYIMKKRRG